MDMFNNREIAIAFWLILFSGWALKKIEIRHSLIQLISIFFSPKIFIPFTFLLLYSSLVVLVLFKVNIWKLANLKETIYWFFFSGSIIAFETMIDDKSDRPFKKILMSMITLTLIIEFIINAYVFSLPVELFFIPVITIITGVNVVSNYKKEYREVGKYSNILLAIIGILLLVQALIRIYKDINIFTNISTLIEFILPLILTTSIIPAIYLLLLYSSYDSNFTRVNIMLDSKEMRLYAKKLILLYCKYSLKKAKEINMYRVNYLYSTASKEVIRNILIDSNTRVEE